MSATPSTDRRMIDSGASTPSADPEPELTCCKKIVNLLKTPKFYLLLVFLGLVVTFIMLLIFDKRFLNSYVMPVLDWIADNPFEGFITLLAIYIVWVLFCLPGSILTLSAGVIYTRLYGLGTGLLIAGLLGNLGQLSGSILAFLTGRYLLYGFLKKSFETNRTLKAIDQAVKQKGLKISFLLRFSLLFPYSIANYGLSITNVTFKVFLFGFLGCIPWEFVEAYFGYGVGNVADVINGNYSSSTEQYIANGIGILLSLILTIYVVRVAYLELKRIQNEADQVVAPAEVESRSDETRQIEMREIVNASSQKLK